jgi:hypothetical protein
MKTVPHDQQDFEDVATTTVRLGRKVTRLARETQAGGTSRNVDFVSRCLDRVGNRRAFDQRDDASLEQVRRILVADLETECRGASTGFVEVGYDGDGPIVEVRTRSVYTQRGEDLLRLLDLFDAFMAAREETLDRAAAERAIRRLMSEY